MFASKTPRDLSHDRFPYLWPEDRRTARISDGPLRSMFTEGDGIPLIHDPRPEFDHAQHNEPNPILVDARQAYDWGYTFHEIWTAFAQAYTQAGHFMGSDYTRITDKDLLVHAYKVLSRLARSEREG